MIKIPLFVIFCFSLISCESLSQKSSLEPNAFESELKAGQSQLLDVRTQNEFREGHLKSALQADWNDKSNFKSQARHLDKKFPVLVYCASGGRSSAAADWLVNQGFRVKELKGGIRNWISAGKPVEKSPGEPPISLAEYKVLTTLAPRVLVDIGADWCPPCKQMEPVLEQLKKEAGEGYKMVRIDAGLQTDLMRSLNAELIPTFIIYKNGIETWRKVGLVELNELSANLR